MMNQEAGEKMITEELVLLMTQRIIDKFSPEKVIVFGSWARGEAHSQSDLDFLVVMSYAGSKRDAQVAIRRELKDFEVPKDIIVVSPEEFQQKKSLNGYIYQPAIAEGKVLYEQQS
jgi:predicted nucleotidyltransferase